MVRKAVFCLDCNHAEWEHDSTWRYLANCRHAGCQCPGFLQLANPTRQVTGMSDAPEATR
jgi:hypothetical protein